MKNIISISIVAIFIVLQSSNCIAQKTTKISNNKITFIELGSVRCIPCQKMQKVINYIDQNYKNQIKTVFYDVWTPKGRPYAKKYRIKSIPTQIFLDKNGIEFARHVGYFPKDKLINLLKSKGYLNN